MEVILENMSRKGKSFETDESLRIKRNPHAPGTGQLAEDMGSSGFASKTSNYPYKSSASVIKDKERVKRGIPKEPIDISDDESDGEDEIDFLSSATNSDEELARKSVPLPPNSLDIDRLKSNHDALKNLRFKKNKLENSNSIVTKSRDPASGILEPKSPNLSNTSHPSSSTLSKSNKSSSQTRIPAEFKVAKWPNRRGGSVSLDSEKSDVNGLITRAKSKRKGKESGEEPVVEPALKERPKPRPLPTPAPKQLPVSPQKPSPFSTSALFRPPVGKRQPLPAASAFPVTASPEHTPNKTPKPPSKPAGFPVVASPENTPKNHQPLRIQPSTFPVSPISQRPTGTSGTRKSTEEGEDNDTASPSFIKKGKTKKKGPVPVAAPFPLDSPRITSKAGPSHRRATKRGSNQSTEEEVTPSKKKRRDTAPLSSSPPQALSDDDEEDDDFYNSSVDANTLCPYCDEPLPPSPTPHLQSLLALTAKKSFREPRPTNPMGRKAAVGVFINVCQRHRFESETLPEAEAKGWPKSIEWDLIHERVMKMKDRLQALMENSLVRDAKSKSRYGEEEDDDEEEDSDWEIPGQTQKSTYRARDRCVFWEEVMEEIKEKGTRGAANVKGQFANFQKAQPGYYGELGSVLIHQTLYELFPPESTFPNLVSPLSPKQFIDRILLPEVAVRLIMEDKSLYGVSGARKALEILRESTTYGVAMFPEDTGERGNAESSRAKKTGKRGGKGKRGRCHSEAVEDEENEDFSVADRMVRETARRRRLELEQEDKREQAELSQEQGQEMARRETRQSKNKRLGKDTEFIQVSSPQKPKPKPRPKPKAIQKGGSAASLADMDVDSEIAIPEPQSEDDAGMSDKNLDEVNNMHINDLDLNLSDEEDASIPAHDKPLESGAQSDSDQSMATSSSSHPRSRRVRKGKERERHGFPKRSPSIEILSNPPSPTSSFDKDATPRAKPPPSSLTSTSTKVGLPPDSGWHDSPGAKPLNFLKRRKAQRPSSPIVGNGKPKASVAGPHSSDLSEDFDTDTTDDDRVRSTRSKTNRQGKKKGSQLGRTESTASDSRWLLSDDSDQ
ncbi:hypothetical protein GYMLUDRAFT_42359 [Collybiopsis luxurians FD-317 M1]|uniref:Restriction of telomere capping protein 4 n=1 Tax=Collybiopsis luxurians FD-317 M1 TaxID=944289 RepID=A0A0D0CRR4_9AGAR|nr:hypothetical protein GYMLUDRAFT_42359 [Collybiopsis luxurians FD-317 M1]